jgi:TetR/AcrR family transcriptional regulator, copper-responsive repressor
MTGKPQYDEASVIAAAIEVFWRNGYASSAISDLTEATGLSRSSLYERFGDKDGLFQEALAAYTERIVGLMRSVEGETARTRLEALLRALKPDGSPRPPGCLIARSCAETSALSAEGRSIALEGAEQQRQVLEAMLRDAIATGELPADTDIAALAWHYLGVLHAVLNFPQAGISADMLDRMIEVAMSSWPRSRGT